MGRDEQWKLRLLNHPKYRGLMAGAEDPPGDGGDDGGAGDEGDGDEGDGKGKTRAQKDADELKRLRREKAEREKADRKAEAARKKAEDKKKQEEGQFQALAEERQDRITELETEIEGLRKEISQIHQRRDLETLATDFGFRRPQRVWAILQADLGDEFDTTVDSEELTKAALKTLAKSDPELVDQQRRSGAPATGQRRRGEKPDPQREHNELVANLFGAPQ